MAGLGLVALTITMPGAVAQAQAAGMPRTYSVQRIDSPLPRPGGSFGWGISSADFNRDGKPELLVAQSQDATSSQVFVFDGATGANIDTIKPPELNPNAAGALVVDPALSFVYIETMPDVGSCPGGDGPDPGKICDATTVGAPDGVPEILAGARGLRVNAANGQTQPTTADPSIGRGYIIDGATRAVIKRVDMPAADRAAQAALGASPQFARVISSPQAMPPCAGLASENNNVGVGPCPDLPTSSRIGDLNGDGSPDILITARNYSETPAQAVATSQCRASGATSCTSGKAYAYSGLIAASDPQAILETPLYSIQNPLAQSGGQEFGGNLYRVGDINSPAATNCSVAPPVPAACAPEFVIPARNLSYPLFGPFVAPPPGSAVGTAPTAPPETTGIGAAFLFNGATGVNIVTPGGSAITSPEPQKLSQFSGSFNGGRAVGDLGASTAPDILLPAALQNAALTDDGKLWAFNGVGGGGGATGSWQFASITDPTPQVGGNFGGAFTGVGNVADGAADPANEVLVAGFHFDPFTEATDAPTDLHFMNVQTGHDVMAIPNPDNARGDGFGVGLTPMGDLNGDGFLDFGVSSYLANVTTGGDGRAFIFRSDNSPLPTAPAAPPAAASAPPAAATAAAEPPPLKPGRCANQMLGTTAIDTLAGTLAGDQIFAFAGADAIKGFQGEDCIDGGTGNDAVDGGADNDKLIGGSGNDKLTAADGRDDLFGGAGNDVLDGGDGRDMLAGGNGNDRLTGGPSADRLFGEAGKDRIVAGSGSNRVDGGAGNDSIEARNGAVDTILCGKGEDRVRADRVDKLSSCEHVTIGRAKAKAAS